MTAIVDIQNLSIRFGAQTVVDGLDLSIYPGESVALVGESGSGKTVTARALLGLQAKGASIEADRFTIQGQPALANRERDWRQVRGREIGYVLQDALVSLDPLRTVGQQLADALTASGRVSPRDIPARSLQLLHEAGMADAQQRLAVYPHQLSGGLRQRVLIACALAGQPALLIADEPTTALDMTVQKQILTLLRRRRENGQALLLISHDLAVVAELADRVLVMRDGKVVESGETRQVLTAPQHPWTRRLLRAIPTPQTRGFRLASERPQALPPRPLVSGEPLVNVSNVHKYYGDRHVVNNVSFQLRAGETLGVVGESGSGKSSLARLLLGLSEPQRGSIDIAGVRWSQQPETLRRSRRAGLQLIAQDPLSSFDPRYNVERLIGESLDTAGIVGAARRQRVLQLLDEVSLSHKLLHRYPRELSGGQRQRVAIARAFAPNPALLVADEPVSALDVSVQAQILDLLADMQTEHRTALLFISHDLGVIHHLADRVLVMKEGRIVESGDVEQVFKHPVHPWTQQLLDALPAMPGRAA
ncbi:ABC transporter ATP-binding protein (plasmid) [Erwinia sp. INIA-01]|uniref:dipeptide ABC transporter ATP-binding protein n=1 Tax=Erwinia sp. INIA01 TaxID=2991500 RepID=UPI00222460D0|nr:ABC transporter ATP-binding protein [Erwinia sp. INIA01]MCW1872866.1 ABC transporter ATP-binding protein [Erwinia sp. INIA01]